MHDGEALDIVGALEGTDKSSTVRVGWDYLRHYARHLEAYCGQELTLMEVGAQQGGSLRMWEWYFPKGHIIGVDINPNCKRHERGRIKVEIGSQFDAVFMQEMCDTYQPTIFIDDGSHLAEHLIFTFETVFPLLPPGATYIVEDLVFHHDDRAQNWQTENVRDAAGFFAGLMRARMLCHASEKLPGEAARFDIDSVTAIGGAIIVTKRGKPRDPAGALAIADSYLQGTDMSSATHEHLARFLLRHKGSLGRAETELKASGTRGSERTGLKLLRAELLLEQQLPAEAATILLQLAARSGLAFRDLETLINLLIRAGELHTASAQIEAAIKRFPRKDTFRAQQELLAALRAGG